MGVEGAVHGGEDDVDDDQGEDRKTEDQVVDLGQEEGQGVVGARDGNFGGTYVDAHGHFDCRGRTHQHHHEGLHLPGLVFADEDGGGSCAVVGSACMGYTTLDPESVLAPGCVCHRRG